MKKTIAILLLLASNLALAQTPHSNISEAVFAQSIEDRAPIGIITQADNSLKKVYFFTNIRNLTGEHITHRWIYTPQGTNQRIVKAEVGFDVNSKRWRIWSSKNLWHSWTGVWTVEVLNRAGDILLTKEFTYKTKHE